MPTLARTTFIALVLYTGLSMALEAAFRDWTRLSAGPITIDAFDLVLLAAILLLAREILAGDGPPMPRLNRTVVFLVFGYCAYQLAVVLPIAVIFHDLEPIGVGRELVGRFSLILVPFLYLVVLKYVPSRQAILLAIVCGTGVALYEIYKYASIGAVFDWGTRLRLLGGSAVLLFGFVVLCSFFLLRPSIVSYVTAILAIAGIALTNHRSAYLALLVVGVPLLFHFRRVSSRTGVVVLVAASCVALFMVASPTIRDNVSYSLSTMVNPSADRNAWDRVERSRLAFDYFEAHPLGDHAWNREYYLVYLKDPFEPHNFVMQFLGQQGVVGFLFIAAIIAAIIRIGWRNRREDRMSAVMLACVVYYVLFNMLNTNFLHSTNFLAFALPAAIILDRHATLTQQDKQHAHHDAARTTEARLPGVPSL